MKFIELSEQLTNLLYDHGLTAEERLSASQVINALERLEREYQAKRRKQAQREVEHILCRDKVTPEEVFVTLRACGITVVQPKPHQPDRRWWEFWK